MSKWPWVRPSLLLPNLCLCACVMGPWWGTLGIPLSAKYCCTHPGGAGRAHRACGSWLAGYWSMVMGSGTQGTKVRGLLPQGKREHSMCVCVCRKCANSMSISWGTGWDGDLGESVIRSRLPVECEEVAPLTYNYYILYIIMYYIVQAGCLVRAQHHGPSVQASWLSSF